MRRCGLLLGSRCGRAAKPALTHATANATTSIGRHVSGIADPFNGHIDEFRIAHVQRSDGWIETTWIRPRGRGRTRERLFDDLRGVGRRRQITPEPLLVDVILGDRCARDLQIRAPLLDGQL